VRRITAGVPAEVSFQTKPEIALQQMRQAHADGVPAAVALMDPAYGNNNALRAGIRELGQPYVASILPTTAVWRPGETALPPPAWSGRGRAPKRLHHDQAHHRASDREAPGANGTRSNRPRERALLTPNANSLSPPHHYGRSCSA